MVDLLGLEPARVASLVHMKPFSCMPAVKTPEAPRDARRLRISGFCLPLGIIGSAAPTDYDFGANIPFTFIPACTPPCLRFAVTVTGHHARLGTRLLARLYRGSHPRPPNFMRFPRRNALKSRQANEVVRHSMSASWAMSRLRSETDPRCF